MPRLVTAHGLRPRTSRCSRLCHDRRMATATARRIRLDQLLVERGLAPTRARAQALVLAGQVRVGAGDGARRDLKSGDLVARDADVAVAGGRQWVSRGAHKLIAALDAFGIDPTGTVGRRRRRVDGRVHRRAAGRAARRASTRSTSGTGSSRNGSATTSGSSRWSGRTRGRSTADVAARAGRPRRRRRVVHLARARPRADRGPSLRDGAARSSRSSSRSSRPARRTPKGGVVRDPAIHRAVLQRDGRAAPRRWGWGPGRSSRRRSSGRRATGSSWSHLAGRSVVRGDRRADRRGGRGRVGGRSVTITRIGFAYNPTIEDALELRERAAGWCRMRGIEHWASPAGETADLLDELRRTDVLVVLGGDGTFLRAGAVDRRGRRADPRHQPRQGRLPVQGGGARARDRPREARRRATTRSGSGWGSRAGSSRPGGRRTATFTALNDIVVARGSLARVVRLDVTIDESHLATFVADGLVVSSPTGSTGYSFSRRRPDPRPAEPQPHRDADRGYLSAIRSIVVVAQPGRAGPRPRRPRGARLASTAARTADRRSATSSRSARSSARSGSSSRPAPSRSGTCCGRRSSCCRRDPGEVTMTTPASDRPAASSS